MYVLTPYVLESVALDSKGTLPLVVCKQSAVNIGNVIRAYSVTQNDGQLLNFITFFKAAAVAFLEICNANIPM